MSSSEVFVTLRWFGESWGAPVCDDAPHVDTPVGSSCSCCGMPIMEGERGLSIPRLSSPWGDPMDESALVVFDVVHLDCWTRNLTGGPIDDA